MQAIRSIHDARVLREKAGLPFRVMMVVYIYHMLHSGPSAKAVMCSNRNTHKPTNKQTNKQTNFNPCVIPPESMTKANFKSKATGTSAITHAYCTTGRNTSESCQTSRKVPKRSKPTVETEHSKESAAQKKSCTKHGYSTNHLKYGALHLPEPRSKPSI